ncbi:class I SAM-dependent methyltransferase [Gaoshiqia sediminis]|uniref:Class I SAM-dependent methyltransferase n=1 Tax=Gaoshiqia sediminis TaxID=2986998 RepID=A0AA41Y4P7_9BACT|nr:class I SAM-dependent methyltransferase [Gaoshiqia sediminis]MCW0483411.1 class I SAM-dependent methyltransferase [Gaoshiqia sediminis]
MNIFAEKNIAQAYDAYYQSEQGRAIDELEKQAIRQLLEPVTPGEMLEIGCGTGHWTAFFSELDFRVTATDVADEMMNLAKEKALPNVRFMTADVRQLPFADCTFDQVAVITALEFCGDVEKAFSEIKRVLKPGGWLITGCLNAASTLGKTKHHDPVFQHGDFMTSDQLTKHLLKIGEPTVLECVHLSADFRLLDETDEKHTAPGVFLAAAVQKRN